MTMLTNESSIKFTSSKEEVASWIRATVNETRLGSSVIKAVMDIPPVKKLPGPVLAYAISMVLKDYSISIPVEILDKIKKGVCDNFNFYVPAKAPDLRPREVKIDTSPEISIIVIRGAEPVDGVNGTIELFFEYKIKAGRIMADGSIDFRMINKFPQAKEGDCLLRIYEPTAGSHGTDVYGAGIEPVPGMPLVLKIDEEVMEKQDGIDDDRRLPFVDWYACRSGIIVCSFINDEREPQFLESISIQNQLVVKNIDFTTGNITGDDNTIKCAADLVVKGDIKGQFTVQIDGSLEVKGTIEGENVDVSDTVKASFIRSNIKSGRYVEVGAALSASIIAKEAVTVVREIADCIIMARDVFLRGRGEGMLCGRVTIKACRIEATNVVVRNNMEIMMGEELFEKMEGIKRELADIELHEERFDSTFRDLTAALGEKIQKLPVINDSGYLPLLSKIKTIAGLLLKGELPADKVKDALAAISSGEIYNLRGIINLVMNLAGINEKLSNVAEQRKGILSAKENLEKEMGTMFVMISGTIAPSGQITVSCGGKEVKLDSIGKVRERLDISLRYDPIYGLVAQEM